VVDKVTTGFKGLCDNFWTSITPPADLYFWFADEADEHEEQDRDYVVLEARPVVYMEGSNKRSYQHKKDGARTKDRASHQHYLQQTQCHTRWVTETSYTLLRHYEWHQYGFLTHAASLHVASVLFNKTVSTTTSRMNQNHFKLRLSQWCVYIRLWLTETKIFVFATKIRVKANHFSGEVITCLRSECFVK